MIIIIVKLIFFSFCSFGTDYIPMNIMNFVEFCYLLNNETVY